MLPVSFLIFLAVWLILLPAAYKSTGTDMGLFSAPSLAAHNLNFVFMLTEALLNRLCITSYHFIFVFYYGGLYVVFSWIFYAFHHFFFYFFIDWRYPLVLIGRLSWHLLSPQTVGNSSTERGGIHKRFPWQHKGIFRLRVGESHGFLIKATQPCCRC